MINIYRITNGKEQVSCNLANDNATVVNEIMGREEVNIDVVVDTPQDILVGDYVRVDGIVYTLNREPNFEKVSDVEYKYDLVFESPLYRLMDKLFVNPITSVSNYSVSRTLKEFAKLVVDCMNTIDSGWSYAASIPQTKPKLLTFDAMSCRDVLTSLAGFFDVEFYLVGKEIHFVNRIENQTGLIFEQGKGKGLYSISQQPVDNENTVTRVYPYGSNQNVVPGKGDAYGRVCLPEKCLENFSEYSKIVEKEVEFPEVFPHFEGSVDLVSGEFNKVLKCNGINFNIEDYAIGGTPVKINFLSGDLMGEAFEFQWNNARKEIMLIIKEDENALPNTEGKKPTIPNALKKVQITDTFNFTDLNMPTEYYDSAVVELRAKATEWLNYHSRSRVKYALEVDYRYLRGKHQLKAGDLLTIKIPETGIEKLLRVTLIEHNLKTGKVNCTVSNYLDEKWEKKIEGQIRKTSEASSTIESGLNAHVNNQDLHLMEGDRGVLRLLSVDSEGRLKVSADFYSTKSISARGASTSIGSGTLTSLDDLVDVDLTGKKKDSILKYNGTHWVIADGSGSAPDLTGYATESWVDSQGFLKAAHLTGYAKESWVNSQGFLKASNLSGYATQTWISSNYVPVSRKINAGMGLAGGATLSSDLTLKLNVATGRDWNTMLTETHIGFFSGATNSPVPGNSIMGFSLPLVSTTGYNAQFGMRNNRAWMRTKEAGTINPWVEFWHTDNSNLASVDWTTNVLSANTITIRNTGAVEHLKFPRTSANYITAPASGYFVFLPNGKNLGVQNSPLVINDNAIYPGTTSVFDFGMTSYRWRNIYSAAGNFSGTVSVTGNVNVGTHVYVGNMLYTTYIRGNYSGAASDVMNCSATTTNLGQSVGTTYLRSGDYDLIHIRNGISRTIWDSYNFNPDYKVNYSSRIGATVWPDRIIGYGYTTEGWFTAGPAMAFGNGGYSCQMQLEVGTGSDFKFRSIYNNAARPWNKFWHSGNSNLSTVDWVTKNLTASGSIHTTNGALITTQCGCTLTIGSGNTTWVHFNTDIKRDFYFHNSIAVNGNIYPYVNNGSSCGTSSKRWAWIYASGGDFSGNVKVGDALIFLSGNKIAGSNSAFTGFYTSGNAACPLAAAGITLSDNYSDVSKRPARGIYSKGEILSASNIKASGSVTARTASDVRLKENFRQINNALGIICKLTPFYYTWRPEAFKLDSGLRQGYDIGLSAQDVKKYLPAASISMWNEYLGIDYSKITPLLIAGMHEFSSWKDKKDIEIERLRKRVETLENQLKAA